MKQNQADGNRYLSAMTSIYLAIMLSLYLLYFGSSGYQGITGQKWKAYLVVTGAYIVLVLLLRVELIVVGVLKKPVLNVVQKLILGYLCITAISAFLSEYTHTAIMGSERHEGLITIALYGLSFILISAYGKAKPWMLWLYAIAISLNCILCLIQFAGYNPFQLYPEGMTYYDANIKYAGEYLGTIGNADLLSAVLSLSIPLFWASVLVFQDRKRFLLLIPLVLCLVVLLKAFVLGGIVGTAGVIVLSFPLLFHEKTTRRRLFLGVAGLFVFIIIAVYLFGGMLGGPFYEAYELMHGRWDDSFGSGRLFIWRNVCQLIPESPILGGGPDTLGLRTDAAFERYDETLGIVIHSAVDTAHNEYLNILVNQGVISLAFYVAALIVSAVAWIRYSFEKPVVMICGCAVLGYCIQALFGISSPITTPYLWIALGVLHSECQSGSKVLLKSKVHSIQTKGKVR